MIDSDATLYTRLGGYDAIAAVAEKLISRLTADDQLGRFWRHRGDDGLQREKQLLIDFLCANAGGPLFYTGRGMSTTHRGMGINLQDWEIFIGHVHATLEHFAVPATEQEEMICFIETTKAEIVDA